MPPCFPIVLTGRGVKLKALTSAVDGTEPPGSSLIHEEIHNTEQIFVLNIEGKLFLDSICSLILFIHHMVYQLVLFSTEMWDSLEVFGRNVLRSWKLNSIISHNLTENHRNSIKV